MTRRASRRSLAVLVIAFAAFAASAPIARSAELAPLRDAADRAGLMYGSAAQPRGLDDAPFAALLARHVNTLTFENDAKWSFIHPARDRYEFKGADRVARFAQQHGMRMRGHVLAWHAQNPPWLKALHPSREEAIALLRDHIRTVVGHFRRDFPGLIVQWDVVNEGIDNDGTRRQSVWQRWIGEDYMDLAFRFAREAAGPDVLLFYNDYFDTAMMAGAETIGGDFDDGDPFPMTTPGATGTLACEEFAKCRVVKELVTGLVRRGVPIAGVGFQGHLAGPEPSDHRGLTAWVGRLGLRWALTELDRPIPAGADPELRSRQAQHIGAATQACVDDPACDTIVTWGLSDRYTWWPGLTGGALPDALPFDSALAPKPAAETLGQIFGRAPAVACSRTLSVRLPLRRGERVLRVVVLVDGARVRASDGHRRRVGVLFTRLAAGPHRIVVRARGRRPPAARTRRARYRTLTVTRRVRACG